MTETLPRYLQTDHSFQKRRNIQRCIDLCLPPPFKHLLANLLWRNEWKHLKRFDHRYTFDRKDGSITAMRFKGKIAVESSRIPELLPPIQRPVTLVTTGPSALAYDWEALKHSGRFIIAVTGGASFLKERGIIPDLLVVTDPNFSKVNGFHVRNAEGVPLIIEYRCAAAIHRYFPGGLDHKKVSIIERVNLWYGTPSLPPSTLKNINLQSEFPFYLPDQTGASEHSGSSHPIDSAPHLRSASGWRGSVGWSHHMDWGFYPSATVAFVALQAAVGLGAKDIEIIGMDLRGNSSVYQNAMPSKLEQRYASVILPSFQTMNRALAGKDIRIRNLSPVCPLPPGVFDFT
ncbi:MAG: hypothetical protein QM627_06955 [Luteolibacter sp.]